MSDHAASLRSALVLAGLTYAEASLDALVADRDAWIKAAADNGAAQDAAEAEVARLRKALTQIAHPTTNNLTDADLCRRFARAALAKEDTDE